MKEEIIKLYKEYPVIKDKKPQINFIASKPPEKSWLFAFFQACYDYIKSLGALSLKHVVQGEDKSKVEDYSNTLLAIELLDDAKEESSSLLIGQTIDIEWEPKTLYKNSLKVNKQDTEKQALLRSLAAVEGLDKKLAKGLLSKSEVSSFIIDEYFTLLDSKNVALSVKSLASSFAKNVSFLEKLQNLNEYRGLRKDLINAKKILWPICSGELGTAGNHWYLLILEKNEDTTYNIYCLDGFNTNREAYLRKGENFLQALYPERSAESLVKYQLEITIPIQNNVIDCGPVICFWATKCAKENLNLKDNDAVMRQFIQFGRDYYPFRNIMAQALVKEKEPKKKISL